tara:strand:- start:3959 stop:5503 length:1545 start_codon:yes stop_codon:yes gene_type:complete
MPNSIKNKVGDPIIQEFAPNDIIINIKDGKMFYKSQTQLFEVLHTRSVLSASAGGAVQHIQFNDGIALDINGVPTSVNAINGVNGFKFDKSTNSMIIAGSITASVDVSASQDLYAGRNIRNANGFALFARNSGEGQAVLNINQESTNAAARGPIAEFGLVQGGNDDALIVFKVDNNFKGIINNGLSTDGSGGNYSGSGFISASNGKFQNTVTAATGSFGTMSPAPIFTNITCSTISCSAPGSTGVISASGLFIDGFEDVTFNGDTLTNGLLKVNGNLQFGGSANTKMQRVGSSLNIDADTNLILRPDNDLTIQVGTTTYALFDGSGKKFSIGADIDTSPNGTIHVKANGNTDGCNLKLQNTTSTNYSHTSIFDTDNAATGVKAITIQEQTSEKITLTHDGDINYSGNLTDTSDIRIKEKINEISGSLNLIKKLRPVTFNKIEMGDKIHAGFIAQEVQKVIPHIVCTQNLKTIIKGTTYNDLLGIEYDKLVPYLVDAIKDQQKQIDELKKQINGN